MKTIRKYSFDDSKNTLYFGKISSTKPFSVNRNMKCNREKNVNGFIVENMRSIHVFWCAKVQAN